MKTVQEIPGSDHYLFSFKTHLSSETHVQFHSTSDIWKAVIFPKTYKTSFFSVSIYSDATERSIISYRQCIQIVMAVSLIIGSEIATMLSLLVLLQRLQISVDTSTSN